MSRLTLQLVDRLTAAQDLSVSGGSTTAPPNDAMKDMAQPLGHRNAAVFTEEKEEAKKGTASATSDSGKVVEGEKEVAVGYGMLDGANERAEEIDKQAGDAVKTTDLDLEPACLDSEVAAVFAKEEAKALLPPTPPAVRSISPMPVSRAASPRRPDEEREMSIEVDTPDVASERSHTPLAPSAPVRKSSRSSSSAPPRQKRRTERLSLPASLSHLVHPPTCTLYITNLRRPLVHSALHDHLFPSSTPPGPSSRLPPPRQPFAGENFPGLWLSGVKDHAYASFLSEEDALEAAERVEGEKWPEDTGAALHVEFVQDDLVQGLVQEEERAWMNGRQKLGLQIHKDDGAETGYRFEFTGGNAGDARGFVPLARPIAGPAPTGPSAIRKPPVAVPLSGLGPHASRSTQPEQATRPDAPHNAPTGPSRPNGVFGRGVDGNMSIRGRGGPGFGPSHMSRPPADNGYGSRAGRDDRDVRGVVVPPGSSLIVDAGSGKEAGRLVRPVRRTTTRPFLTWREGPGAVASI